MLNSAISVVARRTHFTAPADTPPYEAAWASEAVFFVQAEAGHAALSFMPETSPDGINWIACEAETTMAPDATIEMIRVKYFGPWLRLHVGGPTSDNPAVLLIHLTLKG